MHTCDAQAAVRSRDRKRAITWLLLAAGLQQSKERPLTQARFAARGYTLLASCQLAVQPAARRSAGERCSKVCHSNREGCQARDSSMNAVSTSQDLIKVKGTRSVGFLRAGTCGCVRSSLFVGLERNQFAAWGCWAQFSREEPPGKSEMGSVRRAVLALGQGAGKGGWGWRRRGASNTAPIWGRGREKGQKKWTAGASTGRPCKGRSALRSESRQAAQANE